MKTKSFFIVVAALSVVQASGQNLLNKVKSKAAQEINKLEQGAASNASTNSTKNKLSGNVTRTVAVSLRQGENFDYSESCIDLGESVNQISFIVNSGFGDKKQCFSYKNGVRTAVSCPNSTECGSSLQCSYNKLRQVELDGDEAKKYIVNETETHQVAQPAISDQQLKAMSAYMTKEQMEQVKKQLAEAQKQTANQSYSTIKSRTIQFNGKKYGPYSQLSQFFLTPDSKNFYAVTLDVDQAMHYTYRVISSASTATITIQGMTPPLSCAAAADNSVFAAVTLNEQGKYHILTSQGKTVEIPDAGNFRNVWYSSVGGHLMILSGNNLSYDGQVIKTFDNSYSIEPCNLYVTSDGKGLTSIKDNIISFADGDHFEYPLKIALVNSGGKMYFKWLALENQDVVIYQKPY